MKTLSNWFFGALHGFMWGPTLDLDVIGMCFVTAGTGMLMGLFHGKLYEVFCKQADGFLLKVRV